MLIQPQDTQPQDIQPLENAPETLEPTGEAIMGQASEAVPSSPGSATSRGLLSVGLLIALAMIGGLAIVIIRKRMLSTDDANNGVGTLMDDLRGALRDDLLTQEEFDAAKRALVAKMTAQNPSQSRKK